MGLGGVERDMRDQEFLPTGRLGGSGVPSLEPGWVRRDGRGREFLPEGQKRFVGPPGGPGWSEGSLKWPRGVGKVGTGWDALKLDQEGSGGPPGVEEELGGLPGGGRSLKAILQGRDRLGDL